jgi:DNA-binding transcriptional LysR family regulator
MIRDDLSGLSLFLAVAEKKSFTAAAAELRVTASAVSQAISALEERLGVRLLQRTTRSVGLTEAGARFLARLRPALADVRSSFEALDELRDRPAGTLRVTVPRIAYRDVIEPVFAEFLATYRDIELELSLNDALTDIVADGFDAGIRLGESLDREMIAVRIGKEQRVAIVGSPAYFAKHGKPKRPRELHAHECINYRGISSGALYKWELTENGRDLEIAVNGRIVTNDADVLVRASLDGVGIAHVLESMVARELADGRLVRVLEQFCPPFPGYFLYYPSRRHVAPKLAALVAFLKRGRAADRPARRAPRRGR